MDQSILNNPVNIQHAIINDYEQRLDGAGYIADANNSFMFLLEAFSRTVAESTVAIDTKLNALYPRRAVTTKDLYNHLSDFDYIGFFSSPASFKMAILLHRSYLIDNAIQVPDTNYKLVIIPKDSIFTVGRFKLGLYYPIHIRINTLINNVSAVYDTTEINPLHSLNTNALSVKTVPYNGLDLVSIEFEAYQFDKVVKTEAINVDLGFIKKYVYDDKFYAIRVFDDISGKELSYTMSDSVYDPEKATVQLKVFPETNEVQLSIPQIYFTSSLVNNRLRIEIYTTLGSLDASISNIELGDITANFTLSNPIGDITYTTILRNIPTIIITPIDTKIIGGSNGYTFDQMKDHTIYHNDATTVPVTRLDLEKFFDRKGFISYCKLDNLTDRRYYAFKKLLYDNGHLSVANGSLKIDLAEADAHNSIIRHSNDTITILPTTLYKYVDDNSRFTLVSNTERSTLSSLSQQALANILNTTNYYVNPHHVVIDTSDRYPVCNIYDLFSVSAKDVIFIKENIHLSAQLNVVTTDIRHLVDGSGGYTLRIGIQKTSELASTPQSDINIYLSIKTVGGFRVGMRGVYFNTYNNIDVYDFHLETDYRIADGKINITNLTNSSGYILDNSILLSGEFHIATFVKKNQFAVAQDYDILAYLVEDDDSWLSVSVQKMSYALGYDLSDVVDTNLLVNWTGSTYATYTEDVYLTYEHDVYETNAYGGLVYSIDPISGNVVLNKLHTAGDIVTDSITGEPIIQHHTGDIIKDANGLPMMIASKIKDFIIEISAYDYRHQVVSTDFLINFSKQLKSYHDSVREMNQNILENTRCYFKPIATSGIGTFKLNNITTIMTNLELSFELSCYVPQIVAEDQDLLAVIKNKIIEVISDGINDNIISAIAITASVKDILPDYINSIDLVSMNGNLIIQTLMNITTDKSPRLGFYINLGSDNKLMFQPKVVVNFKSLDI